MEKILNLYLDIETFFDPKNGYGLREMSMVEYCRDSRFKFHGIGFAFDDKPIEWTDLVEVMVYGVPWKDVNVVGHNAKFDMFALKTWYNIEPRSYIDTKGMSRAVLGKSVPSHSLKELAKHFSLPDKGIMKTEGIRDLSAEQEAELAEYCKNDVSLCREIFKKLEPQFPKSQYKSMSQTINMFVNPKLQLNVEVLENAAKEEAKRRDDIFKEIGIDKKEFASNVKFPELLRARGFDAPTKLSPKKVDEKGSPIRIPALALGDTEFLEMLEGPNEELRKLCEARVAAKSTLLETRSTKLAAIARTGRWPFDVEFSGADQTHRFSGGSGAGGNPQNFTRNSALREAVEAPKGMKLVVGDFSNVEMRLVAYLSGDPGLIQAIEKKIDVYCEFASAFYGQRITKENKNERHFGKTAILGLGYGMGWKKFIKTVRTQTGQTITEEESKKAVNLYRSLYSGVPRLWDFLDHSIKSLKSGFEGTKISFFGGFITTLMNDSLRLPSGLLIRFPNLRQIAGEKGRMEWVYDVYKKGHLEQSKLYGGKLLENICQGLAGELCKTAMEKLGDAVVGQVHDELILCVPEEEAELAAEKLEQAMSQSPAWMSNMKLAAEVGIGQNWNKAK